MVTKSGAWKVETLSIGYSFSVSAFAFSWVPALWIHFVDCSQMLPPADRHVRLSNAQDIYWYLDCCRSLIWAPRFWASHRLYRSLSASTIKFLFWQSTTIKLRWTDSHSGPASQILPANRIFWIQNSCAAAWLCRVTGGMTTGNSEVSHIATGNNQRGNTPGQSYPFLPSLV